jgi:hypothetical protein
MTKQTVKWLSHVGLVGSRGIASARVGSVGPGHVVVFASHGGGRHAWVWTRFGWSGHAPLAQSVDRVVGRWSNGSIT